VEERIFNLTMEFGKRTSQKRERAKKGRQYSGSPGAETDGAERTGRRGGTRRSEKIHKEDIRVPSLTGTQRGLERHPSIENGRKSKKNIKGESKKESR